MEMQRRDTDEMRQLIYGLLANQQELGRILEMPESDQIAEELMNQGQMQLQELSGDSSPSGQYTEDMPFTSEPESDPWASNLQSSHPARSYVYRPSTPPGRSATVTQLASRFSRSRTLTRRATSVPRNSPASVPRNTFTEQPSREEQRTVLEQGLLELHRLTGIPPTVKVLNGTVTKEGDSAVVGGAFSDIWRGRWLGRGGKKVAIKVLRNVKASDAKAKKRFEDEVKVWARLENDHILPFYGILTDQGQHIQMVSPWQDNGNVLDYVKSRPETNRIHLLSGAAKGLDYIHSNDITHGNVKCANMLVSPKGEARICDFGMSKVIEEVTETSASATLTASGSARWLAPELIEDLVSSPTKEADTYSFGMAILELVTQKHPYANRRRDASVIHDIVVLRKIPERPVEPEAVRWLPETLWDLMRECWKGQASSRPSMAQVSASIQQIEATNSTPA
ncbi:hypothetical protein H0H81_002117 [Sphagnurus paluster]|uniref:Protein kinase domain-containing protein n=1 Tax=Sphagnurus paluster TaxID=117069 RepID=A0A9P7GGU0_9AGAR|nr:hypothetical protein H0H81_002117 [Sphagnurus paluster]